MMKTFVRILNLEDDFKDSELIESALATQNIQSSVLHITSEKEMVAALEQGNIDLILSDYNIPSFSGMGALKLARLRRPEIPFIFVTGSLGEEMAIETIKLGATDYVLKDNLARLGMAVRRALSEVEARRERKKAEERIGKQARMLDLARDAIMAWDLEDRIEFWNEGAERLYQWDRNSALGRKATDILFRDLAAFARAKDSLLKNGEWSGELRQVTQAGREVIANSRWTLVHNDNTGTKSVLVINTDVTEKKALEAQFLRAQRLESLGALAGGIAHDLNNVLSPIVMATEMLRLDVTSPDSEHLLDTVASSAQRGASMVKQILSFVKGGPGERVKLQIGQLIRDMAKVAQETFPRSIRIVTELEPSPWSIVADATQIYQVLMNLCVNARDAMGEGGVLEVRLDNMTLDSSFVGMHPEAKAGPYVVVSVSDTGVGIPPHIQNKIFEPFFTTKETGKGSGLGLSTVLGIVKSHGGFITVYSELRKGTLFKVYLPAVESIGTQQKRQEDTRLLSGNGELILVVDDERLIREITKETLEHCGYQVVTANDGAEAVAVYASHINQVAAIVTDLAMPFMDGVAAIRAMRRINSGAKVLAVSGRGENGDALKAIDMKDSLFLEKPYTAAELLRTLQKLLKKGEKKG